MAGQGPTYNAGMTRPTLHLVDASRYVFRAWHSMPDDFRDDNGWPSGGLPGMRLASAITRPGPFVASS